MLREAIRDALTDSALSSQQEVSSPDPGGRLSSQLFGTTVERFPRTNAPQPAPWRWPILELSDRALPVRQEQLVVAEGRNPTAPLGAIQPALVSVPFTDIHTS
jgi:hypothetical protein